MLKILILICPIAVDHAHCDRDTAIDVVSSMRVSTPQQCGFMGQAILASTSVRPDMNKQYTKIVCVREPMETAWSAMAH